MDMQAKFKDLAGKSVFITGGGSGIGAALTEGFLAQGAKVAFIGRSNAQAFADQMRETYGTPPLFLQGDISDVVQLHDAMQRAGEVNGPIDVLVNNAANDQRHDVGEVSQSYWDEMIAVNLRAYFFACQEAAKQMVTGGAIINFSSISYMMGLPGMAIYTTSNAGITGMTRSLAREFGPKGIRVNAIAPGWVLTQRQMDLWANPEDLAAHLDRQCLKEHLMPVDMVEPVLFLASNASRMMTGQCMAVDGGVVVSG